MLIPVKAAAGALVRHPHTKQPLPQIGGDEEPALVDENDLHFARLIRDGDLVRCDPPAVPPAKPAKAATPAKDDEA